MDLLMIAYTVLTTILSAIVLEEVRDIHYFPLLGTLGLTVVGIVLAGGALALIPSAFTTALIIVLAATSTIVAMTFFYDLRKISCITQDAVIFEKRARQLHDHNAALCSYATSLLNKIVTQNASLVQVSEETAKSMEAIHLA